MKTDSNKKEYIYGMLLGEANQDKDKIHALNPLMVIADPDSMHEEEMQVCTTVFDIKYHC